MARSSSATSTITIAKNNGFNGTVSLSASGLPSGVTATFNPTSTTTSSRLTFVASSTAATGTFTVVVTGTSGSLIRSTTIRLTVNLPVFQAENAVVAGGAVVENNNGGFHGTGYVNFPALSCAPGKLTATC